MALLQFYLFRVSEFLFLGFSLFAFTVKKLLFCLISALMIVLIVWIPNFLLLFFDDCCFRVCWWFLCLAICLNRTMKMNDKLIIFHLCDHRDAGFCWLTHTGSSITFFIFSYFSCMISFLLMFLLFILFILWVGLLINNLYQQGGPPPPPSLCARGREWMLVYAL